MGVEEIAREPNQEVIETLENMLRKAKTGEIRAFLAVKLLDTGSGVAWAGLGINDAPVLLGEIMMTASQLSILIDGVDSEVIQY